MKYEIKKVRLDVLFPAPWNPRPEITEESVKDLAANLAKKGQLHNIGVWLDGESGANIVIYGNRRVVAARLAGWTDILAFVYTDCTELDAREMTRIENELRIGIDPLEDARQLKAMRDMGLNENEISAQYGVPIATVCRRLKLVDLAQSVRDVVGRGVKITTDALEKISAYPEDIQDEVIKSCVFDGEDDRTYTWASFNYKFNELTLNLDSGMKFDDCASCPLRTGATPDLFGEIDERGLGRCLNQECYKRHRDDVIRQKIAEAIDPSVRERVKLKYLYQFSDNGAVNDEPDDKHPCAYYVAEYDGSVTVKYGPSKASKKEKALRDKEMREKHQKEADEREKLIASSAKKMEAWFRRNFEEKAKAYVGEDLLKIFDLVIVLSINVEFYNNDKSKSLKRWIGSRSFYSWYEIFGKRFLSSCQAWKFRNGRLTHDIIKLFKDVKWSDIFTKQELDLIKKEFK